MFTLKRWANKITDGDQINEPSFKSHVENGTEGFICPVCMVDCHEAELLATHFETKHAEGTSNHEDKQLIVDGASSTFLDIVNSDEEILKNAHEEKALQKQFSEELLIKHKSLEDKAASLATENVTLKAQIDEVNDTNANLQDRIMILENQLAHKNTIDDASVLRQELVSVQRMMDSLTVEKEKQVEALHEELAKLQKDYNLAIEKSEADSLEKLQLQNEIQHQLNDNMSSSKSTIENLQRELDSCSNKIKILEEKCEEDFKCSLKLKSELQLKAKDIEQLNSTLEGQKSEFAMKCSQLEAVNHNLESIIKNKDDVISELTNSIEKSNVEQNTESDHVNSNNSLVLELQKELEGLKNRLCDFEQENIYLKNTVNMKDKEISDQCNRVITMESQIISLEAEVAQSKLCLEETIKLSNKLKSDLEQKGADSKNLEVEMSNLETVIEQMRAKSEDQVKQYKNMEAELGSSLVDKKKLSVELSAKLEELNNAKLAETKTLEELNELKKDLTDEKIKGEDLVARNALLEKKLQDVEELMNQLTSQKTELNESRVRAEEQLVEYKEKLKSSTESHLMLEKQLANLKVELDESVTLVNKIEKDKKTMEEDRAAQLELLEKQTKDKQNLLLSLDNMKLQLSEALKNLERCESDKNQLVIAKANILEDMEKKINAKEKELAAIQKSNSELSGQSAQLQKEVLKWTEKYNEERNKMQGLLDRMESLQQNNNELQDEVKRYEDQEKCLLERCLASQSESEEIQHELNATRRKLEDSQAALHELGRESQTLQMEIAKITGRKWTDDSSVSNCDTCQKEFTLTVRKHHCRNCGNIFCKDCSSRTATLPSSKKPVRVCDHCYQELMKMGMKSG